MPKYKSSFQEIWLNNKKYSLWLQKDEDTSLSRCKLCSKSFSVAAMGIKVLDAYANGTKHKDRLPKKGFHCFIYSKRKCATRATERHLIKAM